MEMLMLLLESRGGAPDHSPSRHSLASTGEHSVCEVLGPPFGAVIALLFGLPIRWLIRRIRSGYIRLELTTGPQSSRDAWNELVNAEDRGGKWVGYFERLSLFIAFMVLGAEAWQAVAGWYAFKLACKWEAWSTIARLPETPKDIDPLDYARARRQLAARTYSTFLVGAMANALVAAGTAWAVRQLS
jgi:hypothetical protein